MPGFTHYQPAMVTTWGHWLCAYVQGLCRDLERLSFSISQINRNPLGAAAAFGTSWPINRKLTTELLAFAKVDSNTLDCIVSRWENEAQLAHAGAMLMNHLSIVSQDLIFLSHPYSGLLQLDDNYVTGSSIMPQKKNPDAAELIRGKSGRVYGNLVSMLTLMKSLPLAYNKDLQEDKEPVFDTVDTVKVSLAVFEGMMKTAEFKKIPMDRVDISGFLTATDMADYLAAKGVPFRLAHEITGQTVAYCIASGKTLQDVTLKELKKISPRFNADVFDHITLESSVQKKDVYGGTAKKQVLAQIARLDKKTKNQIRN